MSWKRRSAIASLLVLVSCGGGGSGSGAGSVVAPPAPTPSPSPTPTFTYGSFDLAVDRVYAGQVASVSTTQRYVSDVAPFYAIESQDAALQTNRGALELAYAANRTAVIRFGGETVSFASADVTTNVADGVVWRRPRDTTRRGDSLSLGRLAPRYQYLYSAVQEISEDVRQPNTAAAFRDTFRYFLIGERTREGDAPTSGTSTYPILLSTTAVGRNRGGGFAVSNGTLTIDHGTGAVRATLAAEQSSVITGTPPVRATLVLAGTLTSSGIAGAISSPDSGYTGSFNGDLFGPRAVETGLVLTLARADGDRAAGVIYGRRN